MNIKFKRRKLAGKLWIVISRAVVIFFVIALTVPSLFFLFPENTKYMSFTNYPIGIQNFRIQKSVLGYNFYLRSGTALIGVWHLVSKSALDVSSLKPKDHVISVPKEMVLHQIEAPEQTIIIYMHGKSYTRFYYKQAYPTFFGTGKNGTHVITFDYTGFADSAGTPSGSSVVNDVQTVLHWVKSRAHHTSTILFYGHSMGTGISSRVVRILHEKGDYVHGLVLESPYHNLLDTIVGNKAFTLLMGWMPFGLSRKLLRHLLDYADLNYRVVDDLKKVETPILILSAEDDPTINFDNGYRVHNELKKFGRNVHLAWFGECFHLGHYPLLHMPDDTLTKLIRNFLATEVVPKRKAHCPKLDC